MKAYYLDALRGVAVIWMIIFHTAYDLRMFNYLDWDFSTGFWYAFPRIIAFTFLFCVGASLNYTHRPRINWPELRKRSFKLGAGAAAVSLGTYFIFPNQWIYFGTLHCILAGSILGALVVNHRALAMTLLLMILNGQYVLGFDIRWLSTILQRPSMDFIPIYPWFWAILAGLLSGPRLAAFPLLAQLPNWPFLTFLGQNSLKIYLLHQPIIFGLIWCYTQLVVR
jgi:uncharacterized membrane protein